MCFTVNVNLVKEELENRYGATLIEPDKYRPSYYYHAFSFPELPALCCDDRTKLRLLEWGLIPSWTSSIEDAREIRLKTFNARSESIKSKPSFSSSYKSKRCIIPVKGFFEWQHIGKEKRPWYIWRSDEDIISLAGLYEEWTESNTGSSHSTFTIVTTDANELMAEIHNSGKRMPVILEDESVNKWLDLTISESDLNLLCRPADNSILKAHTISPLVSNRNSDKNNPDVIKYYPYHNQQLLF